jgi:hypothetical protein
MFAMRYLKFEKMDLSKVITWLKKHKIPVRLIISVIAGIATAMILSLITYEVLFLTGIFPPIGKSMFDTRLVTIELTYHSLYAVTAACITAKLAEDKAKRATFILGTKEAFMWLLGTLLLWHHSPPWYNITKALLGVPLALLGGYIYTRIKKKRMGSNKPVTLSQTV